MGLAMHSPKPLTQEDLQEFQSKSPRQVVFNFALAFATWALAVFFGNQLWSLDLSLLSWKNQLVFFIPIFWVGVWILISNAQLRLAFLGHECIHNSLLESRRLNEWLGTFLCHHFLFSSYSRFRESHLWHHRSLATEYDPDLPSYQEYPLRRKEFIKLFLFRCLSLTYASRFLTSFTEIPFILNHLALNYLQIPIKQVPVSEGTSGTTVQRRWIYCSWFFLILGLTSWYSLWSQLFLYWLIPLLFFTFPVIWLQNAFQHAPHSRNKKTPEYSRTIPIGKNLLLRHLFPLHLNYHFEHHLAPSVPHHHLPSFSRKLKASEWGTRQKTSTQDWRTAFNEFAPIKWNQNKEAD